MIRNLTLASAMTMGLLGLDLTASEARADNFAFQINGKNFGLGFSNYTPSYYPTPVYAAPVYAAPVYQAPVRIQPVYRHYHVYYRDCKRSPWQLYGSFGSDHEAHRVVNRLEYRGFDARVSHH